MYYVVCENIFSETHQDLMVNAMTRYGINFEMIPFQPYAEDIQFVTDRKDVWLWGTVTMSKHCKKYGWTPGSCYNENHDYEVYAPKYGYDNMLNGDGIIIEFGDIENVPQNADFFARPTKDSKAFSGQKYTCESWIDYVNKTIANGTDRILKAETRILLAPIKYNIQQEIRCWVVGGKVVTASAYKIGPVKRYENFDNEYPAIEFAQSMVDKFQVAEAFVLDICLVNNEYKVVEVNNINCAGFYHCDVHKLLVALENQFN